MTTECHPAYAIVQMAEWVDRHREDVDPPQIAVEYVAHLLARLLTTPLTADEHQALTAFYTEVRRDG